jgi:tetratricopeptide (TPR) repeat protein
MAAATPWQQQAAPGLPPAAASAFSGSGMLGSFQRARESFVDAMRIQPKVIPAADPVKLDNQPANMNSVAADLHYHAGRMFEAYGSPEVAAAHYRDALSRSPNDAKLLTGYARIQDKLGNVPEADAAYKRAIELNPSDGSAYNDLAMCHARHGNLDVAMGTLQRAINLEPGNRLYRNNLALVLVDAGRQQEAFQHLVVAHGEAIAHYNLGYMLLERKSQDAAAAHFRQALALNPQLNVARQLLDEAERTMSQMASPPQVHPAVSAPTTWQPSLTRLPSPAASTR